jgi:cobalt-precorrin-7 (C5)-methyltransferase
MHKILVLGIGPGSPDYLLPAVWQAARSCQVLVGGRRQLELFRELAREEIVIDANFAGLIERLDNLRRHARVGVLVSGDPGLYSLLAVLDRHFNREELEVYPGISSLQYLFARGALTWQDAVLYSLHGRCGEDLLAMVQAHQKLALFTDPGLPVGRIARLLVEQGVRGKRALVGENLSYPTEKVRDRPLEEWVDVAVADLAVMVIYDE